MDVWVLASVAALLTMPGEGASLSGTVSDAVTAAPLIGAVVTLTDLGRFTRVDSAGRYVLMEVPPGPQHVTIRCLGYASRSLHALVPREGAIQIDVSLRPQPVRLQPIEVRGSVPVRGLDHGDPGQSPDRRMSIAAVRHHPLLAEPDALQALSRGEVVARAESPGGLHIRGGASDHTAYLIDGIPVFSPYHAAGLSSAWNPDALSRLHVSSTASPAAYPHALAGTVEAYTKEPGTRMGASGSVSSTQARLTIDGPLGAGGAGFVAGVRSGMHDVVAPRDDASFLTGGTGDWLAKLDAPLGGGRLRLLGYGTGNEVSTSPRPSVVVDSTRRNVFDWFSQSLGAEWRWVSPTATTRVAGWRAVGDASSTWRAPAATRDLRAERRDLGLLGAWQRRLAVSTTEVEVRVENSQSSYRVVTDSGGSSFRLASRLPVASAFAHHARRVLRRIELDAGATLAATRDGVFLSPRARCRCEITERFTISGAYARAHQFAQSLRNPESVIGNVFPVDVFIGAGATDVPVARSDHGLIAADFRPAVGLRFGIQGHVGRSRGLVLVAPRDGGPFAAGGFAVGAGTSRGIAVDAAMSTARLGLVASYGLQRVRYEHGDSSYVPDHAATHVAEAGAILFPSPTASIRLGVSAALGRRATAIPGEFEWESCNLLDRGCELAGSPDYGNEPLGATALPAYCRVDLGLRKHWHVAVGARDAQIAVFGSFTNVLGRQNVLTYARHPMTGERVVIEMRPPGLLVAGVDFRF